MVTFALLGCCDILLLSYVWPVGEVLGPRKSRLTSHNPTLGFPQPRVSLLSPCTCNIRDYNILEWDDNIGT